MGDMLRKFILLFLSSANFSLIFAADEYLHVEDVSAGDIAEVLSKPRVVELFKLTGRIAALARGLRVGKCMCQYNGTHSIKIMTFESIPGCCYSGPGLQGYLDFRIDKDALASVGISSEEKPDYPFLEINSIDGSAISPQDYNKYQRCVIFAAWKQNQDLLK